MSMPMRWEDTTPLVVTEVSPGPSLRRRRLSQRTRLMRAALGSLLLTCFCVLAIIGAESVFAAIKAPAALQFTGSPESGATISTSAAAERRLGYVTVTGSVVSHNSRPMSKVEAVVELMDPQGRTVQMESAMVAFDPLPNGQSSPYRVELMDDKKAVAYRVRFRQLDGSILN